MNRKGIQHKGVKHDAPTLRKLAIENLTDEEWRLNNLYKIINEDGEPVQFKLRPIQKDFLDNMWWRNTICKSRQHGFTSFIDIWILDKCLIHENITAVIIAHKKDDAEKILKTKVKFPYDNLHPSLKAMCPIVAENKSMIEFANGSSITVTTSGRSGTAQILHVSELGYTSKHHPETADEIVTGSLPAVHKKGYVFIESTAEGASGRFYELAQAANNLKLQNKKLIYSDYKIHFYSWFDKPDNTLTDEEAATVIFPERLEDYFEELAGKIDVELTYNQKAWYASQEAVYGDKMKQEHPSTLQEAFEASGKGNYLTIQMEHARVNGHIGHYPHQRGRVVYTFWDIGTDDYTAVWFMQQVGNEWHVIDYYEKKDKGMDWNIANVREIAREKGYHMGNFVGPHDLKQRGRMSGIGLDQEIKNTSGIEFDIVAKVSNKYVSIQALRNRFSLLRFNEETCQKGLERLDNYRKKFDKTNQVFLDTPVHDEASDASDAIQQWALYLLKRETDNIKNNGARPEPGRESKSLVAAGSGSVSPFKGPENRRPYNSKMRAHF